MAGRESSVVKRGMTYFSTDSSNSNAKYRRSSLNDHVDESCRQITSNSPLFYIFYVFSFPFVELKKLNIKNRNPRGIIYNRISTILKNFHHSILERGGKVLLSTFEGAPRAKGRCDRV